MVKEFCTYDILLRLDEDGTLNQMIRKGLLGVDLLDHINIYKTYKKYRSEGNGVMESYKIAATIHSVHFNTVYLIRKKMEF